MRGLMCWFFSAWHRGAVRRIFEKLSDLACRVGNHCKKCIIMPIGLGLHLFFAASATEGHKKLKNIAFVRDFEHFDNEIDLAGVKGWEDMEVDNVKPQDGVILLGFMSTMTMSTLGRRTSMRKFRNCTFLHSVRSSPSLLRLHRGQG